MATENAEAINESFCTSSTSLLILQEIKSLHCNLGNMLMNISNKMDTILQCYTKEKLKTGSDVSITNQPSPGLDQSEHSEKHFRQSGVNVQKPFMLLQGNSIIPNSALSVCANSDGSMHQTGIKPYSVEINELSSEDDTCAEVVLQITTDGSGNIGVRNSVSPVDDDDDDDDAQVQRKHLCATPYANQKRYQCEGCAKFFSSKNILQHHVKARCDPVPSDCALDERLSTCNSSKTVDGAPTMINNSDSGVDQSNAMQGAHTVLVQQSHVEIEPAVSNNPLTRKAQKISYVKCKLCTAKFKFHYQLHQHRVEIHNQINNLRCSYCGKTFYSKSNLTMHVRSHTGEKPYGCNMCDRSFTRKGYLEMHKLEVHNATIDTCSNQVYVPKRTKPNR